MNGAEYTEIKADFRRIEAKLDKVIAGNSSLGERVAKLEQADVSQVSMCAAHSEDIKGLKASDQKQDQAILKVSLLSSGFVGAILLVARPLVERLLG